MLRQARPDRGLTLLPPAAAVAKAAVVRTRTAAWRLASRPETTAPALRILCYHRVSASRDALSVTPADFDDQMATLAASDNLVVDVVEGARQARAGTLPRPAVAITFDDGYRDIVQHAVPTLARHGFTATVFVVTSAVDGACTFPWYRRNPPPLLTWTDIGELDQRSPLRFEAHSLTHPNLVRLSDADAHREITGSKAVLEERLGREVQVFSYPVGCFGERERRLVAEAGYDVAVTCEPGTNDVNADRYALRRTPVETRDSHSDFVARLSGAHDRHLPFQRAVRSWRFG